MAENRSFMLMESAQIPLKEVSIDKINQSIIDPTTGEKYDGIVLEGIFADLNAQPNNNKRIYDEEQYLNWLEKLKQQVESKRGVYGELEHPDRYSVNYNYVSHKIIDVWYDFEKHLVMGRVLLLNTPKGKIAQEIVKSGGCLAISARAAGDEIKQGDGTFKAVVKLLTTYDLVYHPGFSDAIMEYKTELNESEKFLRTAGENKTGFSVMIYRNQLDMMRDEYYNYLTLNESTAEEKLERRSMCFLEYLGKKLTKLAESQSKSQEESDEEILQTNEPVDKKQKENKLHAAVQKELSEQEQLNIQQKLLFQDASLAQQRLKKKLDKTVYDDSAGFVTEGLATTGAE